jgi:hypothetical protein
MMLHVFKKNIKMRNTFESYLKKVKERRTSDNYEYSDSFLEKKKEYIKKCWENELSPYKCLEFINLK